MLLYLKYGKGQLGSHLFAGVRYNIPVQDLQWKLVPPSQVRQEGEHVKHCFKFSYEYFPFGQEVRHCPDEKKYPCLHAVHAVVDKALQALHPPKQL